MLRELLLLTLAAGPIAGPPRTVVAGDDGALVERPIPVSPVPAEETLDLFELHPRCRIELVAAEPDVIDPVHIAFDPAGRLWVVEYSDYPNGPAEGEPGLSRIRILTDDDGDGRYENARVFAEKLLFANGLMPWRDGVLVTMNGSLVFMRDADGDGRADERQEWFAGFKTDNPQLRANHPTFALDNHIYVASGLRGGDVLPGADWADAFDQPQATEDHEPVSLSGRDFRFDPLSGAYEAVSGPAQFGLTFDDWGNRFLVSNRNPCDHVVLEERYLKRNPHVAVSSTVEHVSPIAENSRVYPISRTWTTSNLHQGTFTAACGVCIYRGDALPDEFYGNSFTCEPTGNLVHRDVITPEGATFTSHYGRDGVEFLATTDEWFRPVNLTVGPDGAMYIVDMYRAVIEHPQFMPEELKDRPDLFDGTDRGRIYRIVAADAPPADERSPLLLAGASAEQLIEALSHPNAWQRETAHRLLLEGGDSSLADPLKLSALAADSPQARAHALWLLAGLNELPRQTVAAALRDEHPRVVEQAILLAELFFSDDRELRDEILGLVLQPADERLRFRAVLSLGAFPFGGRVNRELARMAVSHPEDHWLQAAIKLNLSDPALVLREYMESDRNDLTFLREYAELVGRMGDSATAARLLPMILDRDSAELFACVAGLAAGLRQRGSSIQDAITDEPLEEAIVRTASQQAMRSSTADLEERLLAIDVLQLTSWPDARVLLELARSDPEQAIRIAAVRSLARQSHPTIGPALLERYPGETPAVRGAIITTMLATKQRTLELLAAVEDGLVSRLEIDQGRTRQLMNHRDPEIQARAREVLTVEPPADRQQVLAEYQVALAMDSDPERGRLVFKKECAQCHRIGSLGVNVAPDISDSRTKTAEDLLTAILDPNRAIDANYFSYTVLDADGVVHTGVIASETATSVTLRQPEGKEVTILRGDIEEMRSQGVSLMPVGLEKNISEQQMADLISFIKNWRYLDGLVPEEVIR